MAKIADIVFFFLSQSNLRLNQTENKENQNFYFLLNWISRYTSLQ